MNHHTAPTPVILVVMGVSGCGKTTVAEALARRLDCSFQEGDSLHSAANVAKMQSGTPLTDADRGPWLNTIAALIDDWRAKGESGVVACSALKRSYRDLLIGNRENVRLVYLHADPAVLHARLKARVGHYMPASLLDSQLATLEPPQQDEHPITVDSDEPLSMIVDFVIAALN
jgi:gluconokinase